MNYDRVNQFLGTPIGYVVGQLSMIVCVLLFTVGIGASWFWLIVAGGWGLYQIGAHGIIGLQDVSLAQWAIFLVALVWSFLGPKLFKSL